MWYVTKSLSVVNNVLKLHNLLMYMDRKTKYFSIDRYNHVVTNIF